MNVNIGASLLFPPAPAQRAADARIEPITQIASTSFVLLGSPTLPASRFAELVQYAKSNPGKLNVAHVGTTTLGYLQTLQLASLTGMELQPIQYKAGIPGSHQPPGAPLPRQPRRLDARWSQRASQRPSA